MNRQRLLRVLSGVFAAIFGVSMGADYFVWTAELLGPIDKRAPLVMLRFYLLYGATLILAAQAMTGLPVWRMSVAWNGLKGWQRGAIGTAIVFIAIVAHFVFANALEQRGLIDQKAIP